MELKISVLVENIEKLRNLLYGLICTNYQLTDSTVVDCSQQLDMLLTEYEKYKNDLMPKDAA